MTTAKASKKNYKPDGYTSVAPYLIIDGAQTTLDFLAKVFSGQPLRVHAGVGGRLRHAEIKIDDTVIMLADSMEGWPPVPTHVHVYVPDVDETYRKAIEAGASSVQEPVRRDDPDKRGGFRDACGTTWWVAEQMGST